MDDHFESKKQSVLERILAFFPERQLLLRANGQVRFLRLTPRVQMAGLGAMLLFLGWNIYSSLAIVVASAEAARQEAAMSAMDQTYSELSGEYERLARSLHDQVQRLERRQRYYEQLLGSEPLVTLQGGETETAAEGEASLRPSLFVPQDEGRFVRYARLISPDHLLTEPGAVSPAAMMESSFLERFVRLEQHQRATAARTAQRIQAEIDRVDTAIAMTELPLDRLLELADRDEDGLPPGVGGPYVEVAALETLVEPDHPLNAVRAAYEALAVRDAVLARLPSLVPPEDYYISSNFGMRRDPYTKRRSFHGGLDMAGWPGTKIRASAPGTVVKAGYSGPYGRMVEIDHGNGLKTRYGHMRRIKVRKGGQVSRGQVIGEMGSTGRSTSTHLHYEIWFDGKPINPFPFVKAAEHVLEIQRRKDG